MKGRLAAFVGVGKRFELREHEVPEPSRGEMLLRVERTNVCGSDLHMWRGDLDLPTIRVTWPVVLGHEFVGRVVKLGAGVTADSAGEPLREGDRVTFCYFAGCGRCPSCVRGIPNTCPSALRYLFRPCEAPPHFVGGFADHYLVTAQQATFRVPDSLTDSLAAGANCALSQTIWGLQHVGLRLGETVVIQGAGGVGMYATCVAREMGAGRIVVLDAVPARLELARACGATDVIDIRELPDARARVGRVLELLGGWGADVVCELVGTPQVLAEGLRMLAPAGRCLEIGNISTKKTFECDPSFLVTRSNSIVACALYPPWILRDALSFLVRTSGRYPLDRIASQTFRLDELDRAFESGDVLGRSTEGIVRASVIP